MKKSENAESRTLFQYQKDCIELIKNSLKLNKNALLSIAPGFGRSVIIVQTLKDFFENNRAKNVLFVLPYRVLLEQFCCELSSGLASVRVSRLDTSLESAKKRENGNGRIFLATLATCRRLIPKFPSSFIDVVFVDECHVLGERDWRLLCDLKSPIIGFASVNPLFNPELLERPLAFLGLQKPTYSYGMSLVKMGDIADIYYGASYFSPELSTEGSWRLIRPRDIEGNHISDLRTFVSEEVPQRNQRAILRAGDILLQNIFDFSKVAIVRKVNLPAVASKNLFIIRARTLNPTLLFDYLQSSTIRIALREDLEELARGTVIRHIGLTDIKELIIPIPYSEKHTDIFVRIAKHKRFRYSKDAERELDQLKQAYLEYSRIGERGCAPD